MPIELYLQFGFYTFIKIFQALVIYSILKFKLGAL